VEHYKYRSERGVDDTKHNSNKEGGGEVLLHSHKTDKDKNGG